MAGKLKVSFNSPQCGWMSIGFADAQTEFHTTTAHTPHLNALPDLMNALTDLLDDAAEKSRVKDEILIVQDDSYKYDNRSRSR